MNAYNNEADSLTYRPLRLSVRPPRCAVFIPDDEDWPNVVRRMLENFCQTWGGVGNILIPCPDEGDAHPVFWRILEAYDPDLVCQYQRTLHHVELSDSARFEEYIERGVQETASLTRETAEKALRDAARRIPADSWAPSRQVRDRVLRYLAPFHMAEEPFSFPWQADHVPSPFVDSAKLQGADNRPFTTLNVASLGRDISLIAASHLGILSPARQHLLEREGRPIEEYEVCAEQMPALLAVCWADYDHLSRQAFMRSTFESLGLSPQSPPAWTAPEHHSRFPFAQTRSGCTEVQDQRGFIAPRHRVVVVGDTASDFCLALALLRMSQLAFWLPSHLAADQEEQGQQARSCLREALSSLSKGHFISEKVLLVSLSLSKRELEAIRSQLESNRPRFSRPHMDFVLDDPSPAIPAWPICLLHTQLRNLERFAPLVGKEFATATDTPIPSDLAGETPSDFAWFVDVSVDGHKLPIRSCLKALLCKNPDPIGYGVRPSSAGMSFCAQKQGFVVAGSQIHEITLRPQLRCPDAEEVFKTLAARVGMRAEHSSAGQYALAALERWGGLDQLAEDLASKDRNKLLQAFRPKVPEDAPGVFLKPLRRGFLSFEDFLKVADLSQDDLRRLIDRYIERGIVTRGLILKCAGCSYAGWYAADEFGNSFRCTRCRQTTLITRDTWIGGLKGEPQTSEPTWYYELSEVVYQALCGNARAPILALAKLKKDARSFLFTPELEFWSKEGRSAESDKPLIEIDVCALVDGKIVIGEAKIANRLESRPREEDRFLGKFVRAAKQLTADDVAFATTASCWRDATKKAIDSAFAGARASVLYLENLG